MKKDGEIPQVLLDKLKSQNSASRLINLQGPGSFELPHGIKVQDALSIGGEAGGLRLRLETKLGQEVILFLDGKNIEILRILLKAACKKP